MLAATLAALLPLALSQAPSPRTFAVAPGSAVGYRLVHRLHSVEGHSEAVEGRARLLPDGTVQLAVRARVDSFDSGNGNRDAHMREVTEAARFPFVTLKAVGGGVAPGASGEPVAVALRGELDFHGVVRAVEIPATVRLEGSRATAAARFPVSLTDHEVERPSLLFVKVEDRIVVEARLVLEEEGG